MPYGKIELIENDLKALNLELNTQCLFIRRGLENKQRTGKIYASHPLSTSIESISFLRKVIKSKIDPDLYERVCRIFYACIDHFIRIDLLIMDEILDQFLIQATIKIDGEDIPFSSVVAWIISHPEFNKREKLREKAIPILKKGGKLKEGILRETIGILKEDFGFKNYLIYCEEKKGVNFSEIAHICSKFIESTNKIYENHFSLWVEKEIGRKFHKLSRYHAIYLLNIKEFNQAFPKDRLMRVVLKNLQEMGIDSPINNRLLIDLEDRKGKSPLSRCVPLRIPDEIHVTIKPMGGLSDYETVLHEIGHGLHFSFTDPSLPYPYRHLPRSFALTECFAFLLQNLTLDPYWLATYTDLSPEERNSLLFSKAMKLLCLIRRYIGKFMFELELFSKDNIDDGGGYSEWMERITGFIYEPEAAFIDLDEDFYSADYIRAWIGEAWLRSYLKKKFGNEWFKRREAGEFLVTLWKKGERWGLDELIRGLGGNPLDISPLEETIFSLIYR